MAGRKAKLASEADGTGTDRAGTERDDRYRAPALDKGLDIIELLSTQPGGLTRAEIAKAMERRPSEVYRMLERLVARDYVTRSREGDRYALSMKLFVLAHRHPPVRRLVQRALPLMDAFAQQAGSPAEIVVATQPETMMTLIADRLARPRGAFLSLLAGSSHLLVQVALRDAGAHQYLELERAADIFQAPQAALPLHRALGFAPHLPTPATLAGRSLLAGAMEISR